MIEDLRVCPVCKKSPPPGQVWKDFESHRRNCGLTKEQKEAKEARGVPDWFSNWMNDLWDGKP